MYLFQLIIILNHILNMIAEIRYNKKNRPRMNLNALHVQRIIHIIIKKIDKNIIIIKTIFSKKHLIK